MGKVVDINGQIFDRLTVISRGDNSGRGYEWNCMCECGKTTVVLGNRLRSGKTKSCGCIRNENTANLRKKHGLSSAPEFNNWNGMVQRCHNPNNGGYAKYGAKGIHVCPEWRDNFVQFLSDMGKRPTNSHSIDRIDGAKGYSPENCRWATPKQQANNTVTNIKIKFCGITKTASQWADCTFIPHETIASRKNIGWCDVCCITGGSNHCDKTY